jgi:hypothetical protein
MKARIPGFSKDLPPKRNLWGDVVDVSSPHGMAYDFLSPVAATKDKPDAVDQLILDNRIEVTMPQRVIDGVRLTHEEYSRYTELAGSLAKEQLDKLVGAGSFDKLSDGPDGMKANLVRSIIMQTREAAQGQLMSENLELRERVLDRQRNRAQVLSQGGKLEK